LIHLAYLLAPLLEQASSGPGAAPSGPFGACGGSSPMLLTMGLVFAIFYFLIIRPSQKREKDRQALLNAIKPGDTVVTTGGLVGKVTGTSERYVVMEISPKVRVRVLRTNVAGKDEEPKTDSQSSSKKPKGKKKQGDQGKEQTAPPEPRESSEAEEPEEPEKSGETEKA
jgi:preprotein translocase subunit YajC